MQFAFSLPYQYTFAMCIQYIEENCHLYYPVPPKLPHPNTLKTPDDYPEEQERLRIIAEKKRLKEAKKAAKLAGAEAHDVGPSSKKKRKLKKKSASPPHASSDDEEKARQEHAALEDSLKDESNAAHDESGSEATAEPDPAPPKKQKLRIPLKKKPGEKPVAKGISIQDPKDKPSARPTIDLSNLVVAKPLASKPPADALNTERRSKQRQDPAKHQSAKAAAPVKPKKSASSNPSAKRKLTEEELRQKDLAEALERNILVRSSVEKKKADEEAARKQKELDSARLAAEKAETKRKLAEAAKNEEQAAAEAKQLADSEAKRKATLDSLSTKKAEKAARASQKKSVVDLT